MATVWRTIKIPEQLYLEIQKFISEKSKLGYTNVPNFVVEGAREKIMRETQYLQLSSY